MTDTPSLLARKLRAYRASHGLHGRMTQEQLAERLGVSVDAVGKYERSVSYLRGDLEHRLMERLGWSRDEVQACRDDWEISQKQPNRAGYRLLDQAAVDEVFGGDRRKAAMAKTDFANAELPEMPLEFEASRQVFVPLLLAFPDHWGAVLSGDQVVASWVILLLLPDDVERFRAGTFIETDLSPDRMHRPILPGQYYGYCPGLVIKPGHEGATPLLLRSFVQFLEALTERDVLLRGIGSISVSAGGAQLSRDLGMNMICRHHLDPDYGVWELPGSAVPGSVFGRRSLAVRRRYADAFPA